MDQLQAAVLFRALQESGSRERTPSKPAQKAPGRNFRAVMAATLRRWADRLERPVPVTNN